MTLPIVAVLAPGAMGAAVAKRLTTAGLTVLTDLTGRSDATKARARDAGMLDTPLPQIASRASWILSILPPSEALSFARSFRDVYSPPTTSPHPVTFVDCNAVNPDTVKNIATVFKSSPIAFLDAGIIGGPPRGEYDPIFYASANPVDRAHLDQFESLSKYGLKISTLRGQGADIGDASALKMSYAVSLPLLSSTTFLIHR
ncbi:hypothetical protein NLI96_g3935 [Meripilus lineatus]|uniref:6-phosphogluconate dehydrogenase NADP-binding domain-containing protein n=1 Tax=Meripilus lineatus TaxID=2056292 RepID=A0AAD5V7F5_9APHY|nr:hypothetical protein NLI96_g3935 [Physisporinus lineatus]